MSGKAYSSNDRPFRNGHPIHRAKTQNPNPARIARSPFQNPSRTRPWNRRQSPSARHPDRAPAQPTKAPLPRRPRRTRRTPSTRPLPPSLRTIQKIWVIDLPDRNRRREQIWTCLRRRRTRRTERRVLGMVIFPTWTYDGTALLSGRKMRWEIGFWC